MKKRPVLTIMAVMVGTISLIACGTTEKGVEISKSEIISTEEDIVAETETDTNTRVISGTMVAKYYHYDSDSTSMEIKTDDGHIWMVDDCIAAIDCPCEVTFNTKGTEDITDDVITNVTVFYDFE